MSGSTALVEPETLKTGAVLSTTTLKRSSAGRETLKILWNSVRKLDLSRRVTSLPLISFLKTERMFIYRMLVLASSFSVAFLCKGITKNNFQQSNKLKNAFQQSNKLKNEARSKLRLNNFANMYEISRCLSITQRSHDFFIHFRRNSDIS